MRGARAKALRRQARAIVVARRERQTVDRGPGIRRVYQDLKAAWRIA